MVLVAHSVMDLMDTGMVMVTVMDTAMATDIMIRLKREALSFGRSPDRDLANY